MDGQRTFERDQKTLIMQLDREKTIKLVIVVLATLAALAVMSTLVQLIQTVLPFLIVGAGVYAGYRWALSDAPAPTADEVEEQARGIFSRFRRSKKAVETTMKVGDALADLGNTAEPKGRRRKHRANAAAESKPTESDQSAESPAEAASVDQESRAEKVSRTRQSIGSDAKGAIEFKDRDVVISTDDIIQPDISRLEEKEKEEPKVTNNVLAQIEERRRRLESGE